MDFLNQPRVRKIGCTALAVGASSAALLFAPVFALKFAEAVVYARRSPIRFICELLFGTSFLITSGGNVDKIIDAGRKLNWPFVSSLFDRLQPMPLRILSLAASLLSFYSFSRGLNPTHGKLRDMKGKTTVITGGTSGIGFETAKVLAQQGSRIIMVVRNKSKAEECVSQIQQSCKGETQFDIVVVKMSNLSAVAQISRDIISMCPAGIDVLILNSGAGSPTPPVLGESGIEESMASMHFAHFIMTKILLPSVNANGRIVVTSSVGHAFTHSIETIFENLTDVTAKTALYRNGTALYSRAKLANALFARHLGRLLEKDPKKRNIRVTSHHPGAVYTGIWAGATDDNKLAQAWIVTGSWLLHRSSFQGAATLIDAAAGADLLEGQGNAPNGAYYTSSWWVPSAPFLSPLLEDESACADFWKRSDQLITPYCTESWEVE